MRVLECLPLPSGGRAQPAPSTPPAERPDDATRSPDLLAAPLVGGASALPLPFAPPSALPPSPAQPDSQSAREATPAASPLGALPSFSEPNNPDPDPGAREPTSPALATRAPAAGDAVKAATPAPPAPASVAPPQEAVSPALLPAAPRTPQMMQADGAERTIAPSVRAPDVAELAVRAPAPPNLTAAALPDPLPARAPREGRASDGASPLLPISASPTAPLAADPAPLEAPARAPTEESARPVLANAVWLADQGGGRARLALSPPELGHVEIEVRVRGRRVEVHVRTEQTAAQQVVSEARDRLADALATRDLRMEEFSVNGGGAGAAGGDPRQAGRDGAAQEPAPQGGFATARGREATPRAPSPASASRGVVDLRV
jgi:hypothetical protein